MAELWKVTCFESTEEKWTEEVRLSTQQMAQVLKMLLCRTLELHEIADAVAGKRPHLLEVRSEKKDDLHYLWTAGGNLLHYTAREMPSP